jgi:hypothetical protein
MLVSRTLSISINLDWHQVYEAVWRPEDFPKWASGLSKSTLTREGNIWKAQGPDGQVTIAFTAHNLFGIMDHWVTLGDGSVIYVPLRIIPNGDGTEVMLTLFRQPGMSEKQFAADAEWIARDLLSLRNLFAR